MTAGVSSAFVAEFSSDVKHAYASSGSGLLERIRIKSGVVGSTHRFHKMGKGLASARITQSDVVPMNVSNSNATATLTDWEAPEYSDIYDMEKISYDEKQELVSVVGGAIARRAEELVLLALDAGASATQVIENFGGTGTGLTIAKIRRAKKLMDAAGVPKADRTFVHASTGLEQLLGATPVTSGDFNSVKALVNGELDHFLGFTFIGMEDRDEGGIVSTANVEKNFAFHKNAIGLAVGMEFRSAIDWIPEKTSWLVNGMYSAGAVAIDSTGIYEVLSNDTAVV